jgi:hypothetical protein
MFDLIKILFSGIFSAVTVTLLSMAQRIAFIPYTTKCSPNKITFPGAEALEIK